MSRGSQKRVTMSNMLLQPADFQTVQTALGTWHRHLSVGGDYYAEFTSHRRLLGLPLVHYTHGRHPQTGRRKTAMGIVAVGRIAIGVFAVGQLAIGFCPLGQLSLGLVVGIGQLALGLAAMGQIALADVFCIGQIAIGHIAIGQCAVGHYVLGQARYGAHILTMKGAVAAARHFFRMLTGS
jgi:hypothetical protein